MTISESEPQHPAPEPPEGGQISEAGSSMTGVETSIGGADAVPDTPDTMESHGAE